MGAVILGWLLVPVVIVGLLVLVLRLGRRAARAPEDLPVQRGKGWIRDDRPADIEYESVVDFRADSPGGGLLNPDPGYVAGRMRWGGRSHRRPRLRFAIATRRRRGERLMGRTQWRRSQLQGERGHARA